jgi:hypothetical protein
MGMAVRIFHDERDFSFSFLDSCIAPPHRDVIKSPQFRPDYQGYQFWGGDYEFDSKRNESSRKFAKD